MVVEGVFRFHSCEKVKQKLGVVLQWVIWVVCEAEMLASLPVK